jgi:hypothetical protein
MLPSETATQRRPFLLDTWAISEYSRPEKAPFLAAYLHAKNYLPVINSLSLTELFNPGWASAPGLERGELAAKLIADLACAIVDPVVVVTAEFRAFPQRLARLPVQLELSVIGAQVRAEVLVRFLRADPLFVAQGKDIRKWAASYEAMKREWTDTCSSILRAAVSQGLLVASGSSYRFPTPEARESFLVSLDRRLLSFLDAEEWKSLGPNIVNLALGASRNLPSVRLSSLLFVHSYIDVPSSARRRGSGSDLGDFFHLWIASYCTAITADTSMKRVLERLRAEAELRCTILNPADLRAAVA